MTAQIEPKRVNKSRERLVDSAISLLHTHAYRAVGVQALCELAGVQRGSFYHFFASKEELTLAALNQSWETFRAEVLEPVIASESDPAARDAAIVRYCLEASSGDTWATSVPYGCIFTRLAASITESEPLLTARLGEIFVEWAGLLGGGLEGWASLADILGRLVLAFVVPAEDGVRT